MTEASPDALAEVRAALESADEVEVGTRVAIFERANDVLAAELAALDEV